MQIYYTTPVSIGPDLPSASLLKKRSFTESLELPKLKKQKTDSSEKMSISNLLNDSSQSPIQNAFTGIEKAPDTFRDYHISHVFQITLEIGPDL